ncbi:transcriptional regulator, ArsR family [Caballeronia arationis]|uniref:Transcriptional regulator, ArsR family n=1 Tax=Caballeronia arationis TaxID=1777142 RepID=A0A7Z7N1J7_9BURK|nr:transcriptional regulator, ArsR family [Caballeronia arationis]
MTIQTNPAIDADTIHKALANPFRREVLAWLKTSNAAFAKERASFRDGVPASAVHARSGLSQSTVSAHVATLIDAGLVVPTRVGQWTLLSRNEEVIRAFARH